jgi:hypothetical protein
VKRAAQLGADASPISAQHCHAERWPIAQRLLRTTDTAFRMVVSRDPLLS